MIENKNRIVVVGSYNKDLTIRTNQLPKKGETVLGKLINSGPGGKGANQAVAATRAGAEVSFIANVGMDHNGDDAIETLHNQGVEVRLVKKDKDLPTGMATIVVNSQGENCIVVIPGANSNLTPQDIIQFEHEFSNFDLMLLQLESPIETVITAASLAQKNGIKVILNPAPAQNFSTELLENINIITPNRIEAELLTGMKINSESSMKNTSSFFHEHGVELVLITLGAEGVFVSYNGFNELIHAHEVDVVDSTGAGDVLNGVFAAILNNNFSGLKESALFASQAATLSVQKVGAQPSIPFLSEIHTFIKSLPEKNKL
jgi:ribokinase